MKRLLFLFAFIFLGCTINQGEPKPSPLKKNDKEEINSKEKTEKEKKEPDYNRKPKELARILEIYQEKGQYYAKIDLVTYFYKSDAIKAAMYDGLCTKEEYCIFREYYVRNLEEKIETYPIDPTTEFKEKVKGNDRIITNLVNTKNKIDIANKKEKNNLLYDIKIEDGKIIKITKQNSLEYIKW